MALIKCPNCGKQYSEHAEKCPKCGLTIQEAQEASEKSSIKKRHVGKIALFVSLIIVVLAGGYYLITAVSFNGSSKQEKMFAEVKDVNVLPYTLDKTTKVGDLYVYGLWGQVKKFKQVVYVDGETNEFRVRTISFTPNGRVIIINWTGTPYKKKVSSDANTEIYSIGGGWEGEDKYIRKYEDGLLVYLRHDIAQDTPYEYSYIYKKEPTTQLKQIIFTPNIFEPGNKYIYNVDYAYGVYPFFSKVMSDGSSPIVQEYFEDNLPPMLLSVPFIGVKKDFKIVSKDDKGNWTEIQAINDKGKHYRVCRSIEYY